MATTMTVRAKGYRRKTITLEYVRHLWTDTGRVVGGGYPNVDVDLWRDVTSGVAFELASVDGPDSMCMTVRADMAERLGMERRRVVAG